MTSIKVKILSGATVSLILLALLGISSYYYMQRAHNGIDEVLEEAFVEIFPVMELESLIAKAAMPANDYLIHGRLNERKEFAEIEQRIDKIFDQVLTNSYDLSRQKNLLQEAQKEWNIGRLYSRQILGLENPLGEHLAIDYDPGELMEEMDATFEKSSAHLDGALKEIVNEGAIHATNSQHALIKITWLISGIFVAVLVLLVVVGLVIAQSIILPLNRLRKGVQKFSDGELGGMVDIDTEGEIGELAIAFNQMAEDIRDFSTRDGLTGILDRREFIRRILEEIQRAKRYRHPLAFLMIDIDRFKLINDEFGHLVGDGILVDVAKKVGKTLRPGDQTARHGGDEIAVILPQTSSVGASIAAGRIRQIIAGSPFKSADGRDIQVTVSVGVAVYPNNALEETSLVSEARAAMIEAKKSGRNKVVSSEVNPKHNEERRVQSEK